MKPPKKNSPPPSGPSTTTEAGGKGLFLHLIGPLTLGLSMGFQLMTTAFIRFGKAEDTPFMDQLTPLGRQWTHPERDSPLYVAGVAVALGFVILIERWWRQCREQIPVEQREKFSIFGAVLQVIAATASMGLYVSLLCTRYSGPDASGIRVPTGPLDIYTLLLPAVMAVVWIFFDLRRAVGNPDAGASRWRTTGISPSA